MKELSHLFFIFGLLLLSGSVFALLTQHSGLALKMMNLVYLFFVIGIIYYFRESRGRDS